MTSIWGCTTDVNIGESLRDPLTTDAGLCVITKCLNQVFACGDCLDNDDDGKIDAEDPDCFGPCHNAENTFFGSIPGQNQAPCQQDCYFDGDTGAGNDECLWSHQCDPLSVAPDFPPSGAECEYAPEELLSLGIGPPQTCLDLAASQSSTCKDSCLPLTPNGCDCFGCCEIPGAPTPVWLGSIDELRNTCDRSSLDDPSRCRPCTRVMACWNPCDRCELCIGKQQVPADCAEQPAQTIDSGACPTPQCSLGVQPCGLACLPPCPAGHACVTGCCIEAPR